MDMYIVLAITAFMMVMFIINKVPFGVTTMTCCVLLAATGVVDVETAFSGFANKIVILIAPMLALSQAITKTSLVDYISKFLDRLKGKSGMGLILAFYAVGIVMAQFIPTTACIAILIVFLNTLSHTGNVTAKRIMLPLLGVMVAWKFRTPIGLGATTFAQLNAMAGDMITDPAYQIKMLDPFIFAIIPAVCLTIYCIFCWKLMPKDDTAVDESKLKKRTAADLLPKNKQIIVYVVFIAVMAIMLLNTWTGNLMYIAPAAGVLVLIFTGCMGVPETVKHMTADMTWMLAGVLTVADALSASGAGDLIGNGLLSVLGNVDQPFIIALIFSAVTVVMTTFISNMGTQSVLIPIAASVAMAGHWDPRGLILIIGTANYFAIAFPSGSGEAAVAYASAGYNPAKVLRFTLPYCIIAIVTCAISATLLYPMY
ncbi:SLC13 family permease [uncultured Gemmiger sp.]|uniref:SLC13 family permease n=1 Tax=uncultured Gemmiger sp. TaxID=1623490 RepID=UPI0025F8A29D|nr:SLC13 family permease [uncultured Gemmiger sp.]